MLNGYTDVHAIELSMDMATATVAQPTNATVFLCSVLYTFYLRFNLISGVFAAASGPFSFSIKIDAKP